MREAQIAGAKLAKLLPKTPNVTKRNRAVCEVQLSVSAVSLI